VRGLVTSWPAPFFSEETSLERNCAPAVLVLALRAACEARACESGVGTRSHNGRGDRSVVRRGSAGGVTAARESG
jgi:hypothetical protein